jgi:TRAP transporter 4TM/12TM fusion protein
MTKQTAETPREVPTGLPAPEPEAYGNRRLEGWVRTFAAVIAICFTLFHIYTAAFGAFPNLIQRSIHVGLALALTFLLYGARPATRGRVTIIDAACVAIAFTSTVWVYINYDRFMSRMDIITTDIVLGILTIAIILEAARRVIGVVFTLLASVALAYAYLGQMLPMPLTHRGMTVPVIVDHLYRTDMGLWGTTTHITSTVVAIFIIFGAILLFSGGGRAFMNIALLIAGRSVGGPAKVATVSSSLFATVSGSAAANVAVTGSFSIPMMRQLNYNRNFAAGVEATASTGGQLMPPIMGAGAFIMAELLVIPYREVMIAAVIPCFLLYFGIFLAVHFESRKMGYAGLPSSLVPKAREVFAPRNMIPFLVPIIGLLVLLFQGYTPQRAGLVAVLLAIVLFLLRDLSLAGIQGSLRTLIGGFEQAGYALILIAVLAATAQIIIGIIGVTGVGVRLSSMMIAISGGELLYGLLIAMLIAIVLGMGMPTTGAYLLAASVLVPALSRLGLEGLQAHLFVFYFAILSAITPPVCAAVFVAAGIARSDWVKSAWIATRLGLAGFIIPFMFVYSPALLMQGEPIWILTAVATASLGVASLAGAAMGRFLAPNRVLETLALLAAALLLIQPNLMTDLPGLVLVLAVVAWQYTHRGDETRKEPES